MWFDPVLLVYAVPVFLIWGVIVTTHKVRSKRNLALLEDNMTAGLGEPVSLHPVIDPAICLGCASCAKACPEGDILRIIDGKAALVEPTHCVGHGACQKACPTGAISLVFGTETRGIDIPMLSPAFETSVPGIFIAGELGGMGLIKNAIEQGRQAIMHAAAKAKAMPPQEDVFDTFIIGAGPAGISASLGALERKIRFKTVDQSSLGGTVAHFPRGKLVMTSPANLPMVGKVKFGEISKEALLSFWEKVVADTGLAIGFEEQVTAIDRTGSGFVVRTTRAHYRAHTVLLAIGRRGTPRSLGIPGEDLPKVVYRLIDPEQYRGKHVLIIGGGDSALEAAASIAEQEGTTVTLSYRGAAFSRARDKNRRRVAEAQQNNRLTVLLESAVLNIKERHIVIQAPDGMRQLDNDAVIICAGGVLPTEFLRAIGIEVETKFGVA